MGCGRAAGNSLTLTGYRHFTLVDGTLKKIRFVQAIATLSWRCRSAAGDRGP
jgi:hypothetical protein